MPELPEVETIKRDLEKKILGQKIVRVLIHDRRVIKNGSVSSFIKNLTDKTFHHVDRRGKAIIFTFDSGHLVVQPMMTGQLIYYGEIPSHKNFHTKVTFRLSNGSSLNYNDQRIFGRLQFCRSPGEVKFLQNLGADPFSAQWSLRQLSAQLARRKTAVKNVLMDQKVVAGIGNIYASEILFRTGVHPQRAANTLRLTEVKTLHRMTREVLEEAIFFRGTSMRDYRDADGKKGNYMNRIRVYGRKGQPCLVCQTTVERLVQGGRSTFFCRRCQK